MLERYLLYLLFFISCCVLLSLSFITTLNSSLPEEHNLVYPACCARYLYPFVADILSMYTLVPAAFETLIKHLVGLHDTDISFNIIVSFDICVPNSMFPAFCVGLTHVLLCAS